MNNISNLDEVKNIAKTFLYIDVIPVEDIPFLVTHPIFEYDCFTYQTKTGDLKLLRLSDSNDLEKIREIVKDRIDKCDSVNSVYCMIRKSYRLAFLKHVKSYLSKNDFTYLLSDAWVSSENPNQDLNCSIGLLTKWFKESDKSILMSDEDYNYYNKLPNEITIYRWVSVGSNPNGLSWTDNIETAKWFAHRFDNDDKKGYIQKGIINKKNVLAYFNSRNENELICNVKNIMNIKIVN